MEPASHGDQDVLNNSTEVHPSNRTDQTDRAVYRIDPRTSGMELRLEPRSDNQTDRTRSRLSRPSRHSKDNSRARLSLGREEPEDRHGFSPGGPSGQSRRSPYRYRRASISQSSLCVVWGLANTFIHSWVVGLRSWDSLLLLRSETYLIHAQEQALCFPSLETVLGIWCALLGGCVTYTAYFRAARDDVDHPILSGRRSRNNFSGMIVSLVVEAILGFIGKKFPKVSFLL
ncbi:hypothetical protein F2Q69_00021388 [Brassica cretica]|uniref:Uncharacterized protein n=1 Tax=Brassica cretica TaxID=69181 RepID=A0A8S9Q5A4_BRACR|nr:hypothetical protein F2Q69_00021388 [Brassica cretica]